MGCAIFDGYYRGYKICGERIDEFNITVIKCSADISEKSYIKSMITNELSVVNSIAYIDYNEDYTEIRIGVLNNKKISENVNTIVDKLSLLLRRNEVAISEGADDTVFAPPLYMDAYIPNMVINEDVSANDTYNQYNNIEIIQEVSEESVQTNTLPEAVEEEASDEGESEDPNEKSIRIIFSALSVLVAFVFWVVVGIKLKAIVYPLLLCCPVIVIAGFTNFGRYEQSQNEKLIAEVIEIIAMMVGAIIILIVNSGGLENLQNDVSSTSSTMRVMQIIFKTILYSAFSYSFILMCFDRYKNHKAKKDSIIKKD